MSDMIDVVIAAQDEAETKAWKALAGYKFYMFGYWAAAWVKFNRLLPAEHRQKRNPFRLLVKDARVATESREKMRRLTTSKPS